MPGSLPPSPCGRSRWCTCAWHQLTPLHNSPSAHPHPALCRQVYDLLSPGFSGRCTAPLLVDKKAQRAVCNESGIICSNFAALARPVGGAPAAVDLRPQQLVGEIDRWNERIYETGEQGWAAAPMWFSIGGSVAGEAIHHGQKLSAAPPCLSQLCSALQRPSPAASEALIHPLLSCSSEHRACTRAAAPANGPHSHHACPAVPCGAVNNGVYKCGFSTTQAGFSRAEAELFATLDELDALLRCDH